MPRSWFKFKATATGAELMLYDDIGEYGVTAKDFATQLAAYRGQEVTLRIHSNGGDVFDGLAIYSALKRHVGGLIVEIDGVAASMASIIALAGDTIRIAANGYIMVHAPSGLAWSNAGEMRDTANTLEKFQGTMAAIYSERTGRSEAEVQGWMAKDTWFTAQEALAAGLVDEIGQELKMAAKLDLSGFRNVPSRAAAFAARQVKTLAEFHELTPRARMDFITKQGGKLTD